MEQNQGSSLFGINVDQTAKSHLAETAKWAKFLSIMGFIFCGFIVLIGLFFGTFVSMLSSQYGENNPYNDLPSSTGLVLLWQYCILLLRLSIFFLASFFFAFPLK
jgi:hypothetical protein